MPRKDDPDVARIYHLHSSNARSKGVDLTLDHDHHPRRFRSYAGAERIALPGRDYELGQATVGVVMRRRRSLRDFALAPLSASTVGRLLFATYGVRGTRMVEGEWAYDRSTPSAGGLYPLELYVATQQVDDIPDGVYHYDARAHELELRRPGVMHTKLAEMTIEQNMICHANIVVLIAAVADRTMWKYGQRGYRYVWLDAGHAGQNLYLAATALGLGPVAIGGFFDGELNALLRLPEREEEVIYVVCVGQLSADTCAEASRAAPQAP